MPRATWKGFLRLSLVTCPVYLLPAATKTKSIRLNQIRFTRPAPEPDIDDDDEELATPQIGRQEAMPAPVPFPGPARSREAAAPAVPSFAETPPPGPATRIALQPVDRETGEQLERSEVTRGYEYDRGQFVTLSPEELKGLDLESSHTIDLTSFVPRAGVDPVYFNAPYYIHPGGKLAQEAFGVIGAAMAEAGVAGIGRVTMARRERQVLVEPRGGGMVLITLRSAEEVREAAFADAPAELDDDMVAVARAIIEKRTADFDPSIFRDRYQEGLRELIDAKLNGRVVAPAPVSSPSPVIDLMAALKRSLAAEQDTADKPAAKSKG